MGRRLLFLSIIGLMVSACGGVDYGGGFWDDRDRGAPSARVERVALGSAYESYLTFSDVGYMSEAFETAMGAETGTNRIWYNRRSGAEGEVIAGAAYLENVDYARGRGLAAPVGLETRWALEPAQGDYTTTARTNLRLGASTASSIVGTLEEGTVLEAVGNVEGAPWMLVARHGEAIGYMSTEFLEQREGGDVLLAGGAPREPVYCRSFEQRLTLPGSRRDQWTGSACRSRGGIWRVEGPRGPGV